MFMVAFSAEKSITSKRFEMFWIQYGLFREVFRDENAWPSYVPRVNARVKNDAFLLSYYFFSNGSEIDLFAQY